MTDGMGLLQKVARALKSAQTFRRLINLYPPHIGAGIRCVSITDDWLKARVELRDTYLNRNLFGTHFGGSLYALCDPWLCLLLASRMGNGYYCWDSSASIDFVKPGRGTVSAEFEIDEALLASIRELTKDGSKHFANFDVRVVDEKGDLVARVRKTIYIRKKKERASGGKADASGNGDGSENESEVSKEPKKPVELR